VSSDFYRDELAAVYVRLDKLEAELELYRRDPAYERVVVAEERLDDAIERREQLRKYSPVALIAGFVLLSGFALTAVGLEWVGYAVSGLGLLTLLVSFGTLAILGAQGAKPRRIVELERKVRLAKGEVGARIAFLAPVAVARGASVPYSGDSEAEPRKLGS
jgi:hypothetical protein